MLDFVKAFKGDEGVVCDQATWHKDALGFRDDAIQVGAKTIDDALGYDFINHIAEADRSVL